MIELVQLERRHADFPKRDARVVVVSTEDLADCQKTQADFPHLTVVSDADLGIAKAAGLVHEHASPEGADIEFPTTILVDRDGVVRWVYRSPSVVERLSPDEVLRAIDQNFK